MLFVIALGFAYAHATTMGYVLWDDDAMIQHNAILQLPFGQAFMTSFGGMYHGDYLPVTMISYWTEIALFGMNPMVQHTINLLLHLINILLLYRLLKNFPEILWLAPALLTLFALHPAQVESVVWISERKGLLAAAFYLGAMVCATAQSSHPAKKSLLWVGYVVLFVLATLAKTNGIFLPIWLIIVQRLRDGSRWRPLLLKHVAPLAACAFIAAIRFKAYAGAIPDVDGFMFSGDRLMGLPVVMLAAVGFYLRLLFSPTHLSIIYPSQIHFEAWMVEIALGGLCVALFIFHLLRNHRSWFVYFPLFVLITLAPVLQIVPRVNFVNDRYIYLPIIGLGGYALWACRALWQRWCHNPFSVAATERIALFGCTLLLALLTWSSHERTEVWGSNLSLWGDTASKTPTSGIAHNNLGLALQETGDIAAAVDEFNKGILHGERDGTAVNACNSLSIIHSSPQKYPQYYNPSRAAELLNQGIDKAPQIDETFVLRFNLALLQWQMGSVEQALSSLNKLGELLEATANHRFDYLREHVAKLTLGIRASATTGRQP